MIRIRFLHCFETMYYKKRFWFNYSLHTTHYTAILINDINGLLRCELIFSNIYVQTIGPKIPIIWLFWKETKENKDKILGPYYPWVLTVTHGYQTSGSPANTRNLAEMEKIWVLHNMCVGVLSTNYS